MNEYEQWLYDSIITEKMGSIMKCPAYQKLSKEQDELQKELEDQITGAQKRTFRRYGEVTIQMTSMEMEVVFRETLSMARFLLRGNIN